MPRLLVLLAAVCFGTTGTALALAPDGASPASVGAARVVLGGALLAVLALAVSRRGVRRRLAGGELAVVAVGALGVAAYQPTFFTGVQRTGVAVGTLIALGSAPVITGLLEWVLLARRPSRRWAVATALAATGVAVLALGTSSGPARLEAAGVLAALAAGASYAVYTLATKRLLGVGWSTERVLGALFGAAAVLLLPVLLVTDTDWLSTRRGAAAAVFLAVVSTALAYLLFARGLRRLPAAEVATLTLAEPVTAGVLALVVLGEPGSPAFWLGALVLVAGLAVLARPGPGPGPGSASGETAEGVVKVS